MTTEVIERRQRAELTRLDPQALIAQAITAGAGIETMERLVALAKDVRAVQAKEAWYEAMAEFQQICPVIKKTRKVATGRYSYSYAPLDEILSTIQPIMGPLGLSVSWRNKIEGEKVFANCRISHTLGHHEESGEIAMPVSIGDDGRGANPMQRVGISTTYAKRYSLLSIIGMAPEDDPDAKGPERVTDTPPGDPHGTPEDGQRVITEPQQKRLHAIARGSGWSDEDVHTLISGFGVMSGSSKDVPMAVYNDLIEKLKVKKA
jgi:hypothetical protein